MNDVELMHTDCEFGMKLIESDSIDLTIMSPPYDDIRTYTQGIVWNFEKFKFIAKELARITKPGGVVVWVVNDQTKNGTETCTSFRQALYFKDVCDLNLHDTMIYQKSGLSFPETNRYYPQFEYMFVFSKGKPKTVNLIADRENKYAGCKNTATQREKDGSLRKQSGNGRLYKKKRCEI